MKSHFALGLLLLASLSSTAYAQKCREGSRCAVSAAGTMMAGYGAVRGYVAVRDIEKRFTKTLMRVSSSNKSISQSLATDDVVNKIRPGDKVIITYSKSNHINLTLSKIAKASEQIAEVQSQLDQVDAAFTEASTPKVFGFGDAKRDLDALKVLAPAKLQLEAQIVDLNRQVSSLRNQLSVTRAPLTKVIVDANDNVVSHEIKSLMSSGKSVYALQRVPSAVMKKIGRATRNSWLLAATAVGLGLLTAEEIISGKISTKLDSELKSMRK